MKLFHRQRLLHHPSSEPRPLSAGWRHSKLPMAMVTITMMVMVMMSTRTTIMTIKAKTILGQRLGRQRHSPWASHTHHCWWVSSHHHIHFGRLADVARFHVTHISMLSTFANDKFQKLHFQSAYSDYQSLVPSYSHFVFFCHYCLNDIRALAYRAVALRGGIAVTAGGSVKFLPVV